MLTGMNAEKFEAIGYYFEQSLKLIVFAYEQIKRDKFQKPYSRRSIHESILRVRQNSKSHNEIEDHLRTDMVSGYLKKSRHLFNLGDFSIQSGVEEFKKNVKISIFFGPALYSLKRMIRETREKTRKRGIFFLFFSCVSRVSRINRRLGKGHTGLDRHQVKKDR